MNKLLLASIILSIYSSFLVQKSLSQPSEHLIHIDTVEVSPFISKVIIKYFGNEDGYDYSDKTAGRKMGRFELYVLGDTIALQEDTVFNIEDVTYEDANFDGFMDMRITSNLSASSGDELVDYYFYNPHSGKFEFAIGDIYNPSLNLKDSTISTVASWTSGPEVYKVINHSLKKIQESEDTESRSYTKQLIGDSMVITRLETVTDVGNHVLADSSWQYMFGKLRIKQIDLKIRVDDSLTPEQRDSGIEDTDVRGTFLFISTELFQYT